MYFKGTAQSTGLNRQGRWCYASFRGGLLFGKKLRIQCAALIRLTIIPGVQDAPPAYGTLPPYPALHRTGSSADIPVHKI